MTLDRLVSDLSSFGHYAASLDDVDFDTCKEAARRFSAVLAAARALRDQFDVNTDPYELVTSRFWDTFLDAIE